MIRMVYIECYIFSQLLFSCSPGVPLNFFGYKILAKRFFGSMKDAEIFGVVKKTDFLGYCTFHQLKSTTI